MSALGSSPAIRAVLARFAFSQVGGKFLLETCALSITVVFISHQPSLLLVFCSASATGKFESANEVVENRGEVAVGERIWTGGYSNNAQKSSIAGRSIGSSKCNASIASAKLPLLALNLCREES
jgi:hypothetical protein